MDKSTKRQGVDKRRQRVGNRLGQHERDKTAICERGQKIEQGNEQDPFAKKREEKRAAARSQGVVRLLER